MNCPEFLSLLHEHFQGKLPAPRSAEVERHAGSCAECGTLMARAKELSCRDFTEFLNEYVDERLSTERRQVFERHLEICADCRNYLQSYRSTMQASVLALRSAPVPPPTIPEGLIRAILAAGKKPPE